MKRLLLSSGIVAALAAVSVWVWAAGTGETITYRGHLEKDGQPCCANPVAMTFHFYDSVGTEIGSPVALSSVPVYGGNFSVELPLSAAVINANEVYLGIDVEGTPLAGRQRLRPVTWSIRSNQSDTATFATSAASATSATSASSATNCTNATNASNCVNAQNSTNCTNAINATTAASANAIRGVMNFCILVKHADPCPAGFTTTQGYTEFAHTHAGVNSHTHEFHVDGLSNGTAGCTLDIANGYNVDCTSYAGPTAYVGYSGSGLSVAGNTSFHVCCNY